MTGRDGFRQLLRAEWTKLRSVGRWRITALVGVALTVGFGVLASASSSTDINRDDRRPFDVSFDGHPVVDTFTFVHRPLSGDGSVTARVLSQSASHEWAGAGLVVKESLTPGSRYAQLVVTPRHGLRWRADFATDVEVGAGGAPRWLRLTRSGTSVTAAESGDGATWRDVGTLTLAGLPSTVEVGLVVYSPGRLVVVRSAGATSAGENPTTGEAAFDNVRLDGATPASADWRADRVGRTFAKVDPGSDGQPRMTAAGGTFTVTGSGDVGPSPPSDDPVQVNLFGVLVGAITFMALGALFVTSEYRRGMIRTTLAASRGRGRTLAAKAIVLGAVTFALGLFSAVVAFLVGQPLSRSRGFGPPAFPVHSLAEPVVWRALVGSALFLAVMAVFGLAVGAAMRRSVAAITTVVVVLVLPIFVSATLPVTPAKWLMYLTPTGGLALQRVLPPTDVLVEPWSAIRPGAGLAVVCAYAVVALAGAYLLLRRRDA